MVNGYKLFQIIINCYTWGVIIPYTEWLTDLWLVFRAITVVDSYFNRPKSVVACVQLAKDIGLTSIPSGNQTWQWEILQKNTKIN